MAINSFLGRTTSNTLIAKIQSADRTYDNPADIANTFNNSFSVDEVHTVILNMKDASAGQDGFHFVHMKLVPNLICDTFSHMINLISETGIFTTALRKVKLITVFKNGDKWLTSNYRPITVLSSFIKVIEKNYGYSFE